MNVKYQVKGRESLALCKLCWSGYKTHSGEIGFRIFENFMRFFEWLILVVSVDIREREFDSGAKFRGRI